MTSFDDNRSRILSKISVAARTLLTPPKNVEFIGFLSSGPTIRSRSRLALAAVFFLTIPILLVGVMRTENVGYHASLLSDYDNYGRLILETKIRIKELDVALWEYVVEQEFENGQAAIVASEDVKKAITALVLQRPEEINIGPRDFLPGLASRLDSSIKRSIANYSSMASVRLSIMSLLREIKAIEKQVVIHARSERQLTLGALSKVGRDQLILFLVLVCSIPIFVGFIPGWIVRPLTRLRQMVGKIEAGHFKDINIAGQDEVSVLAKSLRTLFARKEEIDGKKSSKLFELRNILRSVIKRVDEPVFIVDRNLKISYTNEAASALLAIPQHQMEGTYLSDCMYCPSTKKALEKAFSGDGQDESLLVEIELSDGRSFSRHARIGVVRNRDGEVSRAVLVLNKSDSIATLEEKS